jgi:hypothetical protein
MKILKFTLIVFFVTVSSFCGLLIASNPTAEEYEEFAIKEISTYLNQEGCGKLPSAQASLQGPCQSLLKIFLDVSKIELKQIISQGTEQNNFLLFTIYRTTLALPAPLPTYEVSTVGIFKNFYIYHADGG